MRAPQPIVFPDVEAWAETYLTARLAERPEPYAADVYVASALPQTRRARMVIVRRDGGPRLDLTRELARLTIRVYGRDAAESRDLMALVRALIGAAADGSTPIARVQEGLGPTGVPADAPEYRLLTVEVIVVGSPL